jgi:hypothetical protein
VTWGDIRFILNKRLPGKDLDALDQWIGDRYDRILRYHPWRRLEKQSTLPTVIAQAVYAMPSDFRALLWMTNPTTSLPIRIYTQKELALRFPLRTTTGSPKFAAFGTDTVGGVPQLELYPVPIAIVSLPYSYRIYAPAYDCSAMDTSPLAWIPAQLIINGVRADATADEKDYAGAQVWEKFFMDGLKELRSLDIENMPNSELVNNERYDSMAPDNKR